MPIEALLNETRFKKRNPNLDGSRSPNKTDISEKHVSSWGKLELLT